LINSRPSKEVYYTFSINVASFSSLVKKIYPYPSSPKDLYLFISGAPFSVKSYFITPSSIFSDLLS
jgi:hypothetical protein